jgi:UDP-N-acetyl-D-glucosamine dehydrogenase
MGKPMRGSRVLIMGLAYKSNVDDMRESATFRLLDSLKAQGAEAAYYDPHIPVIRPTREHAHWTGVQSVEWREEVIRAFDCVLIATNHAAYRLDQLAAWAPCIVDTRNVMAAIPTRPGQVTRA